MPNTTDILRSPSVEEDAAPVETTTGESPDDTTNNAGVADDVQGAGASAGEASAPAPNDGDGESDADQSFSEIVAKAKKSLGAAEAPETPAEPAAVDVNIDDLMDDGIVTETKPEPKADAKPEAPAADAAQKPEDKAAAGLVSDADVDTALKGEFADLEDFYETRPLVRSVLEARAENKRLREQIEAVGRGVAEAERIRAGVESVHQAINAIPQLNTSVFGKYGERITVPQMEMRKKLDAAALRIFTELSKGENFDGMSPEKAAARVERLQDKALETAHRLIVERSGGQKKPDAVPDVVNRLRQVSSTRSPAAMAAGRAKQSEPSDKDDGPTAIRKILQKHGLR